MKQGIWHQFGHQSQKVALEQLRAGNGVGVILSPRDLSFSKALEYVPQYRDVRADVLIDPQFYVPDFANENLQSYPGAELRTSISQLAHLTEADAASVSANLERQARELQTSAIIAPAVMCEAARLDILELNCRLFDCARRAAGNVGLPVYGSILLAQSCMNSAQGSAVVLDRMTNLDADGWYFGVEFEQVRVPRTPEHLRLWLDKLLQLAATGKPVLHSYGGFMGILALAAGASAIGLGHSQNTWHFSRTRWEDRASTGGGGDAPARFFSTASWGTLVYPDELVRLPQPLQAQVFRTNQFSSTLNLTTLPRWSRHDSGKHLLMGIGMALQGLMAERSARLRCTRAVEMLTDICTVVEALTQTGIAFKDGSLDYQPTWLAELRNFEQRSEDDFAYLELLQ